MKDQNTYTSLRTSRKRKNTLWKDLLLAALSLSFIVLSFAFKATTTCKDQAQTILTNFNQAFQAETLYAKMSTRQFINGQGGTPLISEVWRDGNKVVLENPLVTMITDETHLVTILHDTRAILIQQHQGLEAEKRKKKVEVPITAGADSLLKYSSDCSCLTEGQSQLLNLSFPVDHVAQTGRIKTMQLTYNNNSKRVEKATYQYFATGDMINRQEIEYLDYNEAPGKASYKGTAIQQVIQGEKLLNKYKNYELQNPIAAPN